MAWLQLGGLGEIRCTDSAVVDARQRSGLNITSLQHALKDMLHVFVYLIVLLMLLAVLVQAVDTSEVFAVLGPRAAGRRPRLVQAIEFQELVVQSGAGPEDEVDGLLLVDE